MAKGRSLVLSRARFSILGQAVGAVHLLSRPADTCRTRIRAVALNARRVFSFSSAEIYLPGPGVHPG